VSEDIRKIVTQGREAYSSGDFDRALEFLLKALEYKEDMADVHNMLGIIFHHRGDIARAQKHFEKALIINPGYTDAALNLSVTYNEQGKYDEARKVYSRALAHSMSQPSSIDPFVRGKLANMHADLAAAYKEIQLYDDCARELRQALALAPTFSDLRTRLAEVLREMGKIDDALAELELVIGQNPKYVPALIQKGVIAFSRGEMAAARQIFENVLQLDPANRSCNLYIIMIDRMLQNQERTEPLQPVDPEELPGLLEDAAAEAPTAGDKTAADLKDAKEKKEGAPGETPGGAAGETPSETP